LLGFAWFEYRGGIRPTGQLSWLRVVAYALVVSVAYQLLFLLAVSSTTSANVALIMATVPMWTALAARFFLREILPPLAWVGLITAFAGTMIVTVQRELPTAAVRETSPVLVATRVADRPLVSGAERITDTAASPDAAASFAAVALPDQKARFTGNVIALLAALAWAGGTVFSRPLLKSISPTQLAACSATIGLPFHIILAGSSLTASLPLLKQVPLQLCILYSGILSTGLALAMWSYGVKHAGAAQAAMFQNLSPVIAIAAAWLWRGETVSIAQTIGGAMIIGGLIIMRQSRRIPAPVNTATTDAAACRASG
jgi:drug/metabolite transporter (DMT)-like permease